VKSSKQRAAARYVKSGILSDKDLPYFCVELGKGEAHPDDAIAALACLRRTLNSRAELSKNQKHFLLRALNGVSRGLTLNQAFGLERPRAGRPVVAEGRQIEIAKEVLRRLLSGKDLQNAAEDAAKQSGSSATQARKYWAAHKIDAIAAVRIERLHDSNPWTNVELERLRGIANLLNSSVQKLLDAGWSEVVATERSETWGLWSKIPDAHPASASLEDIGNSGAAKGRERKGRQ